MDLRKVASILVQKITVAEIHSVNSNFADVVYLKWCIPHLNVFINLWQKKKTKARKKQASLKSQKVRIF